jgi:hypothetical protein
LSTIPQHAWVSKLFEYDLTVEYRPSKLNDTADALLHREEDVAVVHAVSAPTFALFNKLHTEAQANLEVAAVSAQLEGGTAHNGRSQSDGLVLFRGKIFTPEASKLWPELLSHAHAGHEGVQKTITRWHTSFYSPQALRQVHEFVRGCSVCQRNKSEHLHPADLLQPLQIPSHVWSDISMDFIEGFPKVGGKSVILTVVDRFSKFVHFIALSHPYSAASVAKAFFDGIVRLHGIPCSIVSDRDTVFTSTFWSELFKLAGVKLQMSLAFHPQSDGQSEVVNKVITMYLRYLVGDRPWSWLQWLPWAEFCYNSSYHMTLKCSPFKVVYGRDPSTLISY